MVDKQENPQTLWPQSRMCPNCKTHAQVTWGQLFYLSDGILPAYSSFKSDLNEQRAAWAKLHSNAGSSAQWIAAHPDSPWNRFSNLARIVVGHCLLCRAVSVHSLYGTLLWPSESDIPPANQDMPENVCDHYNQARNIAERSPRAAITLLRYCIQELLRRGNYTGTLRSQIATLSRDGGSRRLKRALEAVQQVGNSAAHEDEIAWDMQDVGTLFTLVNLIGDEFYSKDDMVERAHRKIQEHQGNPQ